MYQDGTATNADDLLSVVRAFCTGVAGWTQDAYAVEGTGHRLHLTKGTVRVNLRSFVAEARAANAGGGSAINGVLLNLSTGIYSGASAWYDQSGVPLNGTQRGVAGVVKVTSGTNYWLFAFDNCVYCVIEPIAGYFEFFGWGEVVKDDAFTGGEFFFGTAQGGAESEFAGGSIGGAFGFLSMNANVQLTGVGSFSPAAFMRADYDAVAGWKWGRSNSTSFGPNAQARVFDSLMLMTHMLYNTPSAVTSLDQPEPLKAYIFRDTNNNTSSYFSPLGRLPELHYINIQNIVPAEEITIGTDSYRCFPFMAKSDNTPNSLSSGYLGFCIKSN